MISLEDRVAIVTGGGRGLGRSYALDLARRGASVVVNDLGVEVDGQNPNERPADEVVTMVRRQGGRAVADYSSVADPASGSALVERAIEQFGGLDILICNAGILRNAPVDQLRLKDLQATLDVHVAGSFHLVRAAWNVLTRGGYGRVVLTTSTSGLFGNPEQSAYAAAKMAIVGLTKVWALEGAPQGIKVNAIAPGARTRMTENLSDFESRLGPEFVAPIVSYLASEDCRVTGETWLAAGGLVRRLFLGVTEGHQFSPQGEPPTAEEVAANIESIRAVDPFKVPGSMVEDLEWTLQRLQERN